MSDPNSRYCAFCGLPVPAAFSLAGGHDTAADDYCCSGCRTVASVELAEVEEGSAARGMLRLGLAVFFTMNVMVFTMALWSRDVYDARSFADPLADALRSVFRWASMLFSLPVLWLLGGPIVRGVWQALGRRQLTTDLLVVLGVGAAYLYSSVSVLRGEGHVYFEVGVMVLVFVSLGRWLEAKGKRRTGEALDELAQLLPEIVRKKTGDGSFKETPRQAIVTGDVLRVLPGERLPVDGVILSGNANLDEQMVSGESVPRSKTSGGQVYSGTLNLDGDLHVKVTAADGQETLSRLITMVRAARREKGRHEQLADRIATWFLPLVCLIAVVAGVLHSRWYGLDQGILTALAVVLIACPCALGLATPMAVWSALGRAASAGVLFRSGLVMERLAKIHSACFDKTGTLTTGTPRVTELDCWPAERQQVLQLAQQLTSGSNHLLSQAIATYAVQELEGTPTAHASVETVAGKGLRCDLPELGEVLLGSIEWLRSEQFEWPRKFESSQASTGDTLQVAIGWQGEMRGVFSLSERLRTEAPAAIGACQELGLQLKLLTGDSSQRATQVGQAIALSVASSQLPEDKVAEIRRLSAAGGVAMVGDGLNDAPALAAADVGVALGCGADVSREAAGVCILSDNLLHFPWAVELARTTGRVVRQNLFWAFAYNCIGIGLAATGRLNPILAAAAMAISSLLVIANSLRLGQFRGPEEMSASESSSLQVEVAAAIVSDSPVAPSQEFAPLAS